MTDEEIQVLQQTVLDLQEKQKNYDLDKQAWESEKASLTKDIESLQSSVDTYKDMNARLSLNLATQMTSSVGFTGEQQQEKPDEKIPTLEDILKDL